MSSAGWLGFAIGCLIAFVLDINTDFSLVLQLLINFVIIYCSILTAEAVAGE